MDVDWPSTALAAGGEYEGYADVYDILFADLEQDTGFYTRCAAEAVPRGGAILELGVGTGRLTTRILEAGYRVVGVDASEQMLSHAGPRMAGYDGRCRLVHADARSMELSERFRLAVAPYGMVAHLLTDADRLAAFRRVYDHLEPGGLFVFDDCPDWLGPVPDDTRLERWREGVDRATGHRVRLMSNTIRAAAAPYSVRYDIVDWLEADGSVARRRIFRVVFRNISLDDELSLLAQAGFDSVDLLGAFDGRALDRHRLTDNKRFIARCRRATA